MFGEKPIFGQSELTIDDKGRIFIPVSTKREPGEELVIVYNEELNVHEIYSINALNKKFETLNNMILNSKTKKEKEFYEKRFYVFSKSILRSEKVDSQGRILTGKIFQGEEKLLCTGAYDRLFIEPIKTKK